MNMMRMQCVDAIYGRSRGLKKHSKSDANDSIARAIKSSCDKTIAAAANFQAGKFKYGDERSILKRQKTKIAKHTIEDPIMIAPGHVWTKDLLSKKMGLVIV